MKLKFFATFAVAALPAFAVDSLLFEDYDYQIAGNIAITGEANYIAAFWGTYDAGVFTPITAVGTNTGYFGLSGDDSTVAFSSTVNGPVSAGSTIYLGIFDIADGSAFSAVTNDTPYAVLSDPTWIVPTFNTSPGAFAVSFTETTVAAFGGFTRAGENDVVTLATSAIPEPSSFAAVAGLGILGFAAMRKRRRA